MATTFKKEIFYLSRLLNPKITPACRYSLRCLFRYIKNRYFGDIMAKKAPVYAYTPNNDFELHMLSQKGNLWPLINSIRSFLVHSKLCPKIVIHSDGSMDEKMIFALKSKFSNLEVLTPEQAEKLIDKLNIPEINRKRRKSKNIFLMRFIDMSYLSHGKKVMVMGDDILFFKQPQEIIDFVNGKTSYDAIASKCDGSMSLGVDDYYLNKYKLIEKGADRVNADLMLFKKDSFNLDGIAEYFEHTLMDENYYFMEMAGFASIMAQDNLGFLPIDKYQIKGIVRQDTVMKHFTSPRRHEFYAYGIDLARKVMKKQDIC